VGETRQKKRERDQANSLKKPQKGGGGGKVNGLAGVVVPQYGAAI